LAAAAAGERPIPTDFFPLPESLLQSDAPPENSCEKECLNGSICSQGLHSSQLLSQVPTNVDEAWRCVCPSGYTGEVCDQIYESCNDEGKKCENGGSCEAGKVDDFGNSQFFCDCSNASDTKNTNVSFEGDYCETTVEEVAPSSNATVVCIDESTCQNGGMCKVGGDPDQLCHCLEGFSGPVCQNEDEEPEECFKECQNDGICTIGSIGDEIMEVCECNLPFHGEFCEMEASPCGEEYCFHGSECFEILLSVSDAQTRWYCSIYLRCSNLNMFQILGW